jgi:class 3 adenylate cyclase
VPGISAQELAELVPCSRADIARLEELALLGPDEDGLFPPASVHVVRLMAAFEEAGISLDDVARGVAQGELRFPMELFMPEPVERSETFAALGAELGRAPELLRRLSGELGLPPAADDRVRAEDAEMISHLVTTLDLVDDDELSRIARLYGGGTQRLVTSGLQFFDRAVLQRVMASDLPNDEKDRITYERAARFAELAGALVPWLQRRHREHTVLEFIVAVTEGFMEERGITPRQPKQPPAIAFLDLTGYTALADERGDEAAAEVAAELAGIVHRTATPHGGRPVKWLGDGVMFHYADPGAAIVSAIELVERTERATSMPARIGVNAGAVVAQEGDYFGRTVNIAARIADFARPHEVLVSEDARRSATAPGVEFEPIGEVPLKGVSRPVTLHRAMRSHAVSGDDR